MGVKECLEQACEATEADKLAAAGSASSAATSATDAELLKWEAEAWEKTCNSYANEAEDIFVKAYTSNGNGTFTPTDTTHFSAFHYSEKAEGGASNYRGSYDTLALANAGVVTPVAGDFVLIGNDLYTHPSFYNDDEGEFVKNTASIHGGNSFYGGQTLQWDVLLDGGITPDATPTPSLSSANDFYLKDIAENIEIQNPTGMPTYDSYMQKGIFFIEPNGYTVTWGSLYDFTDAFTWDNTKINRFSYHTFEGRVKLTWAGVI